MGPLWFGGPSGGIVDDGGKRRCRCYGASPSCGGSGRARLACSLRRHVPVTSRAVPNPGREPPQGIRDCDLSLLCAQVFSGKQIPPCLCREVFRQRDRGITPRVTDGGKPIEITQCVRCAELTPSTGANGNPPRQKAGSNCRTRFQGRATRAISCGSCPSS